RVSMMSRVGNSAPLHCTGLGKCLLAFSSPEIADRIIDGLPLERYTDHTLTSPASLKRELKKIAERGYAVDNEEHERGVRCVAAPITGPGEVLLASASISVPSVRLPEGEIESQARVLLRTTERITAGLRHDAGRT
ncbi:MAG: IclR family transcriptional regulator C-terminal domain-containing protein, partial [Spirochaetales bacterium]|nr:IclR family transcriptional regulator C-terminal domain-containing protein [Spirochaetales bacterium]